MARRKADRRGKPAAASKPETERSGEGRNEAGRDRWRPWLLAGLAALFAARPLFPSEAVAMQGDGLPLVMLWLALALFWLLGALRRRAFALRFSWIDGAVVVLVVLHSLAALWAAADSNPRPAINMLCEWGALGLSYLTARQLIASRREARAVVVVMVAVALTLAAHGLYQYFYEMPAAQAAYQQDPDRALQDAGLWFERGSPQRELFEKRLASVEPLATFALTNSLAGYLAPWFVVIVGIGLSALRASPRSSPHPEGNQNGNRFRLYLAVAFAAVPIAICLLLTKSRSGYVATLFGLLLAACFVLGRFRLHWTLLGMLTAVGAVLLAVAVSIGGLDRFVWSEASKSLGYRLEYWQATLHMIADHPVAGCGPGHFQHAYTAYKLPQASEEIADPHNFLLEVWATAGTPALLALLVMLGGFYGTTARRAVAPVQTSDVSGLSPTVAEPDSPLHAILGGGFGFLLSVPLGLMSSAPPGYAPVVLGLPLFAGFAWLFWPWVQRGMLPFTLPAIAVTVLLVNLLAAGGIGLPGVAGTLWLLMAVGLVETGAAPRRLSPRYALIGLAIGVVLTVACYASAYAPVTRYRAAMRLVDREPARAVEHLQEAIAADPLTAEPWKQLANLAFQAWQVQPRPETLQRFRQAADEALSREPKAASTWLYYAERYFEIYERTGQRDDLEAALTRCQRAVELYPNSAVIRAKLAVAYQAAGREDDFAREAAWALELDAITPHFDKKLPDGLRESLKHSGLQEK